MSREGERDLSAFIDTLAGALAPVVEDASLWNRFALADELPPVDFGALLQAADSDLHRVLLVSARKLAVRAYLRSSIAAPDHLIDDASPGARLVHLVAAEAARRALAVPEVAAYFGAVPGTLREAGNVARQGKVARALSSKRAGESTQEVLARAGVSRRTGYRIMDKPDLGAKKADKGRA